MKAILYACLISIFLFGYPANSQQFAMDFSRFDCDSVEHHLFSELDEGKVIILDFVMLGCAPCIWATRNLDTLVQSYQYSHPGRLGIYAFSYESSFTCKQMFDWRTTGGFPQVTLFTDGAEMVEYYGGMGMPTIVITGGQDHKIFYNGYGYTPSHDSAIVAAIDSALNYSSSGSDEIMENQGLSVFPTIFSDFLIVQSSKDVIGSHFRLMDISGRIIMEFKLQEEGSMRIPAGHLPQGMYFASVQGEHGLNKAFKLVRH